MKNLFTALKNLLVSSFTFTSKVNTETDLLIDCSDLPDVIDGENFCPRCGALIEEGGLYCQCDDIDFTWDCQDDDDFFDEQEESEYQDWVDAEQIDCQDTDNVDWDEHYNSTSSPLIYDPMLDDLLLYHEVSADYCEADDLVACPTCGKPMHIHSLQYQNIGECEACYFGCE